MAGERPTGESSLFHFNAAESYAGVIVGVAAADGSVSHGEALEVVHALTRSSLFRGIGDKQLNKMMRRLGAVASTHGPTRLLEACAPGVPRDLRAAAFAWAADIAYSDGKVSAEEITYLKRAAEVLALPDAVAAKVLEVARIRNAD
ncbi:MAG TPA: TerB family tellurite resistance protein [Candidatus Thermoplasmatota archaeon]